MTSLEKLWADVADHFGVPIKDGAVRWIRNGISHKLLLDNQGVLWNKGYGLGGQRVYGLYWYGLTTFRPAETKRAVVAVFDRDGLQTEIIFSQDAPPVIGETVPTEKRRDAIVS